MADPIGGYQNPYWNQPSGKVSPTILSANANDGSDEVKSSSSPIAYIMNGEQDKRPPEAKPENQKGPVGGFIDGVKNGLTGMVTGLFSVNGVLMLGGTLALIAATGGAATPFLVAAGVGVGGFQMGHGLLKGDWEEMGRGAVMAGTSILGAKVDFAKWTSSATSNASKVVSNASDGLSNASRIASNPSKGESFAMALSEKNSGFDAAASKLPTMRDHFRLLAGEKMTGSKGSQESIYQVISGNAKHWISQAGDMFQSSK